MSATIDDTYAEAFRSIYASVLITARDRYWLDRAVQASTGNASSTILCDCEAGFDRYVSEGETPDNRPGAHSPVSRSAILQGPRVAARAFGVGAGVAKRNDLPHGFCVQCTRRERKLVRQHATAETRRKVASAGPQTRLLWRRPPVQSRTLWPAGLGGTNSERRVRVRAANRFRRRSDGRQPLVLRRNGGCRTRRRNESRCGRAGSTRWDTPLPRRSGVKRQQSGEQVQVQHREYLRGILPDASWQGRRCFAAYRMA